DQLARSFITFPARAKTAVNHFLQMGAARKTANILAVHLLRDVAAQQHRCDQANLVNVIALLPSSLPAPRNLVRRVEWIECIGGYAAVTHLMRRNSKVA